MAKANFTQGGGFMDGKIGVIVDYVFTDEFAGKAWEPGKIDEYKNGKPTGKKIERPHSVNASLSIVPDGATEAATTTIRVASDYDAWEIGDDGKTLTPIEDGRRIGGSAGWAKFISSLDEQPNFESGCQADNAPEGTYDFRPIVGARCKFEQRVDEERTAKHGQQQSKKTGKGYDRKDLVVVEYYETVDDVESLAVPKKGARGKSAPVSKSSSKPVSKSKKSDDDELDEFAKETLREILAKANEALAKNKLSTKVLTTIPKDPRREDVRKRVFDDDFLSQEDGWVYNKAKGFLTIAEEE